MGRSGDRFERGTTAAGERAHEDDPLLRTCRAIRDAALSVELPDGRRLGYADRGDPDGDPLVLFHGHPNSRVFAAIFDEVCRERGVRVLAPERPGIGRSDPLPDRDYADWAADVTAFLDALDIDRAPAVGVSAGGPFALACGAYVPKRVPRLGLLCPVGPNAPLRLRDRIPFLLGGYLPRTWGYDARKRRDGAREDPVAYLDAKAADAPEADRSLWRGAFGHALLEGTLEGARQGVAGYERDARLLGSSWDFDPADVAVPVTLRHGRADEAVPVEMSEHVASALPDVDAEFVDGLGHLGVIEARKAEVVDAVVG